MADTGFVEVQESAWQHFMKWYKQLENYYTEVRTKQQRANVFNEQGTMIAYLTYSEEQDQETHYLSQELYNEYFIID